MNTPEINQSRFCGELASRLERSVESHESERLSLHQTKHISIGTPENSTRRIKDDVKRLRRELMDLYKMFEV